MKQAKEARKISRKLIFWSAVVLILAVAIIYSFLSLKPAPPKNQTITNETGNIEDFRQSLLQSRNLSVVMNITNAPADSYHYVIRCGVNYAQSWGSVLREGFNESLIGHLKNYVVNGSSCVSSDIGENVTERDVSECIAEYSQMPYLHIRYGPSFTVFYKNRMEIFTDDTSYGACFFEIKTEELNQTINQTGGNETNST